MKFLPKLPNLLCLLLIFLLFFNAIGAFYGSISMLLDPSGSKLQMPLERLEGSPFHDYFMPGVILLLVNGVLPLVAAIGLYFRRPEKPMPGLPFWEKRLWAWSLAFAAGLGLVIWIGVQVLMIGYWKDIPIQAVYGTLGLVILGLTLLPQVRNYYMIPSK